jgi:hypothetical protein
MTALHVLILLAVVLGAANAASTLMIRRRRRWRQFERRAHANLTRATGGSR